MGDVHRGEGVAPASGLKILKPLAHLGVAHIPDGPIPREGGPLQVRLCFFLGIEKKDGQLSVAHANCPVDITTIQDLAADGESGNCGLD